MDKMREEFEAWASDNIGSLPDDNELAWRAWQAARPHPATEAGEAVAFVSGTEAMLRDRIAALESQLAESEKAREGLLAVYEQALSIAKNSGFSCLTTALMAAANGKKSADKLAGLMAAMAEFIDLVCATRSSEGGTPYEYIQDATAALGLAAEKEKK